MKTIKLTEILRKSVNDWRNEFQDKIIMIQDKYLVSLHEYSTYIMIAKVINVNVGCNDLRLKVSNFVSLDSIKLHYYNEYVIYKSEGKIINVLDDNDQLYKDYIKFTETNDKDYIKNALYLQCI